ncbi:hypothetical protein AwEntero_28250 [Enterobacterales bacterium]|nr:hypothetical protein AwEntero_28250 [Enterobacterales bacterium]
MPYRSAPPYVIYNFATPNKHNEFVKSKHLLSDEKGKSKVSAIMHDGDNHEN